jgi:putative endonuclease
MFYVYILESLSNGDFYKGCTENYIERLEQHNRGESQYTRSLCPWKLIFAQAIKTKSEALRRERQLKRCNKEYLRWLVNQPENILIDTAKLDR